MKLERSEKLIAAMLHRFVENGTHSETVSTKAFFDEVNQENITTFVETVRWLRSENLIRTGNIPAIVDALEDIEVSIVLTADGFHSLGKKFGDGQTVAQALKSVNSGGGFANTGELLGGLLGAFTKSISS